MKILSLVALLFFFCSCEIKLVPIKYGEEECSSCKMIISDAQFGAELVSDKGKVFKYDAAECLFRTLVEDSTKVYALVGVSYFSNPGSLHDAYSASYLISKNLPSPMGGFLSAFPDAATAEQFRIEYGGKTYSFDEVLDIYEEDFGE